MSVSSKDFQAWLYRTIKIERRGDVVAIEQWCRAGREVFEVETIGL